MKKTDISVQNSSTQQSESIFVNSRYQYEDNDIQAILSSRLQQIIQETPQSLSNPTYILAAADDIVGEQLKERLTQEKAAGHREDRGVCIPYNLGNFHWVGIFLKFKKNTAESLIYIDSLTHSHISDKLKLQIQAIMDSLKQLDISDKLKSEVQSIMDSLKQSGISDKLKSEAQSIMDSLNQSGISDKLKLEARSILDTLNEWGISDKLKSQVRSIYPNCVIQNRVLLMQDDLTSCGAYIIENSLLVAQNLDVPKVCPNTEEIRRIHLESLKKHNEVFYKGFYTRQRDNRPTIANLQEQFGYVAKMKHTWFSKYELQRVLDIKQCLIRIADKGIKDNLWNAFSSKGKEEHAPHLKAIREALKQSATHLNSKGIAEDKALFKTLLQLIFNVTWEFGTVPAIDNIKFQIEYSAVLAITQDVSEKTMHEVQEGLKQQIERDRRFAEELQKLEMKLWSEQILSSAIPSGVVVAASTSPVTALPDNSAQNNPMIFSKTQFSTTFTAPRYQEKANRLPPCILRSILNSRFLLTDTVWAVFVWREAKNKNFVSLFIEGIEKTKDGKPYHIIQCYRDLQEKPEEYQSAIEDPEKENSSIISERCPKEFQANPPQKKDQKCEHQGFGMQKKEVDNLREKLASRKMVELLTSSSGSSSGSTGTVAIVHASSAASKIADSKVTKIVQEIATVLGESMDQEWYKHWTSTEEDANYRKMKIGNLKISTSNDNKEKKVDK